MMNLYHGTATHFTNFRASPAGIHLGTYEQAAHVATQKLSRLPLKDFEALKEDTQGFRGIILHCRVEMGITKRVKDARNSGGWARVIEKAKREGYDSLVYLNEWEGRDHADSYVVFDPGQIKSKQLATG
jgi:hypothetical protein